MKVGVTCILCDKEFWIEVDPEDVNEKTVYEFFYDKGKKLLIEDKDNTVVLNAFICNECFEKLKNNP